MAVAPPETLFDEILDFLASTLTSEQISTYEPPPSRQQRLSDLLEQNRQGVLAQEEQTELDEFLRMNRFMSRLKLRARQKLASS
jgi:hypothetical protein